jgi:hypothetical protein
MAAALAAGMAGGSFEQDARRAGHPGGGFDGITAAARDRFERLGVGKAIGVRCAGRKRGRSGTEHDSTRHRDGN